LHDQESDLTVIVGTVESASATGRLRRSLDGSALADLRRSLEALTGDEVALARAIRRPLQIDRLGRHPLGNLVIQSLARAFGDLGKASAWLGEQLGIAGSVLPATIDPVNLVTETGELPSGASASISRAPTERLRFVPEHPQVSAEVLSALKRADLVLLAPGPLWGSVLGTSAIPDVASALDGTRARVVWICNLEPEAGETASDHLDAFRRHGVRVDAVLYDPSATLHFSPQGLADQGVEALPHQLRNSKARRHDSDLLREALINLIGSPATAAVDAGR
jgi:uncharacterized cofD-like protein